MTEIGGIVAGAAFRLRTDLPALASYARQHLAPLLADVAATNVTASLRWHEGQPPVQALRQQPEMAQMERVDRDLYRASSELRWFRIDDLRDLFLTLRWKQDGLEIEGDFYYRLGNSRMSDTIRRARQWQHRDRLRERRFPTLLAYLVYYPCWWWLERTRAIHPIHAAGVKIGDSIVLLAGASGVGKSTLAVALAADEDGALLSDSFVLHSGRQVTAVREPILLDKWSRQWLGRRAAILQPMGRNFGLQRSGFHIRDERYCDAGTASLLVFPRRSSTPFVRQISGERAHQWISAGDLMINDLRRYWAFAAVLEQLQPCGLMARREAELASLTGSVPSVEVGIAQSMSCDAAVETILRLCADVSRRGELHLESSPSP